MRAIGFWNFKPRRQQPRSECQILLSQKDRREVSPHGFDHGGLAHPIGPEENHVQAARRLEPPLHASRKRADCARRVADARARQKVLMQLLGMPFHPRPVVQPSGLHDGANVGCIEEPARFALAVGRMQSSKL